MYLEELIIEGFKSYATRTVISPWDPQFNAITGLNGSGKSNILDALCFVLGLDNLRQVRAANLADLVYKRGQAGITRASVTAVFSNEDEAASPIGYVEQDKITVTRQIVCGTNKQRFFINGHSVPQKSVDSLFQSVQLNVNHPHFLIMQGQITKVLNMKPAEILAMVEESAGTRMFEDRRQKAHQTLEKKDGKVQEIGGLLREMIEPKLDTLRVQRSDFVEYKRAEADLERLRKLILANDFWNAARTTRHETRILQEGQEEVSELTQKISGWKREAQDLEEEINTIIRKRQKDKNLEQRLKALEQQVVEAEKTQVRQQSRLEIVSQSLKEKAVELKEAKKDLTRIQSGKKVDAKVDTKAFDACRARYEGLKEAVQQDEALLQGLTTGISVQGAAGNYEQLLNEKQQQLSHLQVTLQTGQQRLADLHAEIKSKQPQVNKAKKNVERTYQEWQVVESEIASLVQQLENSEDVEVGDLEKRHQKLKSKLSELNGKSASLRSQVGHLTKFEYSEPYGGFDHSKVKGVVADLITLKDAQCSTAIEVAAGGRLFNVVVADDATGKDILEKGKLSRRVTIIPLNKISSRPIPTDKQRLAAEMTDGNAQVALSLVGSPRELSAAMEYVFGGTFVCKDKASAERVAFDKALGVRAVTLDGDVYEPSGTLTGGSAPANAGLLDRLFAYKALQSDIRSIETELSDVEKALLGAKTTKNEVEKARKTVEMKKHQLSSQRDAFAKSSGGLLITSFEATEKELQELSCILPQLQERIKDLESQVAKIEKDSNEFGKDRNGKIKELRLRLENNQAQLAKAEMEYNVMQRNVNSAQVEKEHFSNTLKNMQNSINDLEKELDELKKEGEELESGLESNTAASLRTEYERERIQFAQNDSQVKQLEARKSVLSENVDKAQLAITQSQQQLEKSQTNLSKAEEALKALGQKYPWLKDQQSQFGVADGPWDFANMDMGDTRRRLQRSEDDFGRLRKTVNLNVMDMIDRMESKENSLKHMLDTVKKDKSKIETTLEKLEDYKLEALEKTWQQVNADFGAIFGELLPGGTCRLDPVEGGDLSQGLCIKVALGGVWKSGLMELSGGQRSLVALALILALLQHKPAPLYILDEVDAALDLSHTQNIGNLLKTRFKGAQFIVVSLKEGMFNNANVLFRTRVKDGISSVERLTSESIAATDANSKKKKPSVRSKATTIPA